MDWYSSRKCDIFVATDFYVFEKQQPLKWEQIREKEFINFDKNTYNG